MNDDANRTAPRSWTAEKTAWWLVFGILTLTLLGMLSLWN
jgi:hypothetical protein